MSLIVHVVSKGNNEKHQWPHLKPPYPHNEMFGFEAWRKEVWGHDVVRELDCTLIHSLRESDVYAYDDDVITLQKEFEILLENVELLSKHTGVASTHLSFRLENGLAAVALALEHKGESGVSIG